MNVLYLPLVQMHQINQFQGVAYNPYIFIALTFSWCLNFSKDVMYFFMQFVNIFSCALGFD